MKSLKPLRKVASLSILKTKEETKGKKVIDRTTEKWCNQPTAQIKNPPLREKKSEVDLVLTTV